MKESHGQRVVECNVQINKSYQLPRDLRDCEQTADTSISSRAARSETPAHQVAQFAFARSVDTCTRHRGFNWQTNFGSAPRCGTIESWYLCLNITSPCNDSTRPWSTRISPQIHLRKKLSAVGQEGEGNVQHTSEVASEYAQPFPIEVQLVGVRRKHVEVVQRSVSRPVRHLRLSSEALREKDWSVSMTMDTGCCVTADSIACSSNAEA